jgi:sarcosine oxidase subunit beta
MGYINAATRLGVDNFTGVEVTGFELQGNAITAVNTQLGKIWTPIVINTAGPWAGRIGELAGVEIPITPLRRQILTTTPLPEIPEEFPFVIDFAQSLYFHREGEGLLTGMSNLHEKPGFDQEVDPEWEIKHLEAASKRMPLLEKAGLQSHWAGLYENTPDAHPIFGTTPVTGLFVCAGFSGHGFMHGPVSGLIMSEIILDGDATSLDVSTLSLDRFKSGRLIKEYNVI